MLLTVRRFVLEGELLTTTNLLLLKYSLMILPRDRPLAKDIIEVVAAPGLIDEIDQDLPFDENAAEADRMTDIKNVRGHLAVADREEDQTLNPREQTTMTN